MNKYLLLLVLPIFLFSAIGVSHYSANNNFIINSNPQSFIYYNQVYEPLNTTVYLNATVSGGTPPYTLQWYLNNTAIAGADTTNLQYTLSYRTNYSFYLNAIDITGASINSKFYNFTTNPYLIILVNKVYNPLNANQYVNITYDILQGSAPFNTTWNVNGKITYYNNTNLISDYSLNDFSAYGLHTIKLKIQDKFQTEYFNYSFFAHNVSFETSNGIMNNWQISFNGIVYTVSGNSVNLNVFGNLTWSVLNSNNVILNGNTSGYVSTQTNNVVVLLNIAQSNNDYLDVIPFVAIVIALAGFLIIIVNYRRKE
jgi:hypothetical protein